MYRITTYGYDEKKDVIEFEDEDSLREFAGDCINDLEKKAIKTFIVSRIAHNFPLQKPFWEKE